MLRIQWFLRFYGKIYLDVKNYGSFPFVPPQYVMRPPVAKHVPLHSKSLCKYIARASGGCK